VRVFVPGFTQAASSWSDVAARLDGDQRLLDVPPDRDFVNTAHALDAGPAEYVGYSMGGRLCLQLALDHPRSVRRLVLVSASPGIADDDARAARRAADEELARAAEREGVETFLRRWLGQPMFATLPAERAGLRERVRANTVESLAHQLRALGQGTQPSNWDRLGELSMPVVLVVGALDGKYVEIARSMHDVIARSRVVVVDGAGHACHLERPDELAHVIASS